MKSSDLDIIKNARQVANAKFDHYVEVINQPKMKYEYPQYRIKTIEDIADLCRHHLKNIGLTELDLIENQDITKTDEFYINMFRQTWQNLLNEIEE